MTAKTPAGPAISCPSCALGQAPLFGRESLRCLRCDKSLPLEGKVLILGRGTADTSSRHESWQREIYDSRASDYGNRPAVSSHGLDSLLLTYREHVRMIHRLGFSPGYSVLDIGCSDGRFLNLMAEKYGIQGVGVDLSIEALRLAADRNPYGHRFFLGSLNQPFLFVDNCFERATCFDVLEHLEKSEKVVREVFRVLKPGGRSLFHIPVSDIGGSMDWIYKAVRYEKWKKGMEGAGHDYKIILSKRGYEDLFLEAGFRLRVSRRFNSMFQNIFDYHLVHRILNRVFYLWKIPFSYYHQIAAPIIEMACFPDRILQAADIGASVYIVAEKPAEA